MRYVLAGAILLTGLACFPTGGMADEPAARPPQSIQVDVLIAETPEGTTPMLEPAAILALEKAGKLSSASRFRLTCSENQRAMVQFSELMPRATGRTIAARGFGGADGAGPRGVTQYTDISLGTMLSASAHVEDNGRIAIDLKVSRSRLVPQKAEGAAADATDFTPSSVATLTVESSLTAKPGEPTLVGGRQTTGGKEATQTWVVLTVSLATDAGAPAGKAARP